MKQQQGKTETQQQKKRGGKALGVWAYVGWGLVRGWT